MSHDLFPQGAGSNTLGLPARTPPLRSPPPSRSRVDLIVPSGPNTISQSTRVLRTEDDYLPGRERQMPTTYYNTQIQVTDDGQLIATRQRYERFYNLRQMWNARPNVPELYKWNLCTALLVTMFCCFPVTFCAWHYAKDAFFKYGYDPIKSWRKLIISILLTVLSVLLGVGCWAVFILFINGTIPNEWLLGDSTDSPY